jgi:hypothetical protein
MSSQCQRRVQCCNSKSSKYEDIKQLKADNLALTERVEKLEKLINDMFSYQPGGEGYQETKEHFETISKV